jgi:hypothetical protein
LEADNLVSHRFYAVLASSTEDCSMPALTISYDVQNAVRNRLKNVVAPAENAFFRAYLYCDRDPAASLNASRQTLEYILQYIHSRLDTGISLTSSLNDLIQSRFIRDEVHARVRVRMESVRILGNLGSHAGGECDSQDAARALHDLLFILEWFLQIYDESFADDSSLAGGPSLSPRLSQGLCLLRKNIDTATTEQFKVLEFLREHRRVSISGCAGSGKTLLAMEKATRLDRAGLHVMFLCHNPFLAEYVQDALVYTKVEVNTFCNWIRSFSCPYSGRERWSNFDEPTSEELNVAFDALSIMPRKYDALIVDEAQDFGDDWWVVAEASLKHSDCFFYIFFDNNQALLPLRARYPVEQYPYHLEINCRNATEIASSIARFNSTPVKINVALEGGKFQLHWFVKGEEETVINRALSEIISDGIEESIFIVTIEPGRPENSILANRSFEILPKWSWQEALRNAVSPRWLPTRPPDPGLGFPTLSEAQFPTDEDMAQVSKWARSMRSRTRFSGPRQTVSWMVFGNQIELRGPAPLNPQRIFDFLADDKWANTLPKPRLIRIAPFEECTAREEVPLHTAASVKGLEADAVITFVPSSTSELRASTYVAMSRARLHQHLVLDREVSRHLPRF